ncbi:TPR-like protein [Artomyces pyxidatus]|uniref:TPR-like protein n=1 Tax=Artomyces pyxidatus TaxID=48021 RepID=A0ACB8TFJ8_9AGAM|nr:TPR-like protein [Artomyces pyxidatus]
MSATELKDQGNALFTAKKYEDAIQKYTAAIALDEANAVLYCNRAACHLALKSYNEAKTDAEKAIGLDPKYRKAWARLATAQDLYRQAITSWKSALDVLPKENLTAGELQQKKAYQAGLEGSERLQRATNEQPSTGRRVPGIGLTANLLGKKRPWDAANEKILSLLFAGRRDSSCLLFDLLWQEFSEGVQLMMGIKKQVMPGGRAYVSSTQALQSISNALLMDVRVFQIHSMEWVEKFNMQSESRAKPRSRSPQHHESVDSLITSFRAQYAEGGFDLVRPSITVLLRSMICIASIHGGLKQSHAQAVETYDKIIAILRWGRQEWPDASKDDRGAVFETTFLRGVRGLRLESYMQVRSLAWRPHSNSTKFTLEGLLREADDILAEIKANPQLPDGCTPGFIMAFTTYQKAQALAMKGFYWNKIARHGTSTDLESIRADFRKAHKYYMQAVELYPTDDETHVWYMRIALDALLAAGTPLRECMPLLKRIRVNIPAVKNIWEFSALGIEGFYRELQNVLCFEEDVQKAIDEGQYTLDDAVLPKWVEGAAVRYS